MGEFLAQTVAQCINSIHDLSPLWKKRKSCAEFPSDAPNHWALTIFIVTTHWQIPGGGSPGTPPLGPISLIFMHFLG